MYCLQSGTLSVFATVLSTIGAKLCQATRSIVDKLSGLSTSQCSSLVVGARTLVWGFPLSYKHHHLSGCTSSPRAHFQSSYLRYSIYKYQIWIKSHGRAQICRIRKIQEHLFFSSVSIWRYMLGMPCKNKNWLIHSYCMLLYLTRVCRTGEERENAEV